jgi:hypothetical protein
MQCERDTGSERHITSAAELEAELAQVARGGHIILSDDNLFIQAARNDDTFLVQYGENDEMHEAASPVDRATLTTMMEAFRTGNEAWRTMVSWRGTTVNENAPNAGDGLGAALGASLGGIAKSEAGRALRRGAGRAIRQGLRRFIR